MGEHSATLVKVRDDMILRAVSWVCNRLYHTIDRSYMNPRSISEKMDDGIMGEIASVALLQFLESKGRRVIAYDDVRRDDYKEPDPGWDILAAKQSFDKWLQSSLDIKTKPPFAYSFSIKSSRIPKADNDDIATAIGRRDFKIFKHADDIASDLTADFEVQVFYLLSLSNYHDNLVITKEDIIQKRIESIVSNLKIVQRYSHCYLSGAASREKIIEHSKNLPVYKRSWSSNHFGYIKQMWVAPLILGTSLEVLK